MSNLIEQERLEFEYAQTYWERAKKRMEWCRHEAEEYLKNTERSKFYKLSYSVDSGQQIVYAAITDDDRKLIEEGIKKTLDWVREESGPDATEEDKEDALSDYFLESYRDIYWDRYIPERDLHWTDPPIINGVDFNDVKHFCKFKVKHTSLYTDDIEELKENIHNVFIPDDVYVNLLTAKLFDQNLTFYDLQVLYEDVYNEINALFYSYFPHLHYIIFMTEINEAAKAIIDSKTNEELPEHLNPHVPHSITMMNTIFKEPNKCDDEFLLNSLKLVETLPDIFDL